MGEIASLIFVPVAAGGLFWLLVGMDWPSGSKAEWFSGLASFGAVAVALWQSVVIRRQAAAESLEATERFQLGTRRSDRTQRRPGRGHPRNLAHRTRLGTGSPRGRTAAPAGNCPAAAVHISELQQRQAISILSRAVY
ncbi:MAG: hypothetical protein ABWY45_00920 [Mycobacterium sp.]